MYNVLIADDDVDAWFQVNALLRRYFIKASFVSNLTAAKQYLEKYPPSLLFFHKQLDTAATEFIRYVRAKYPMAKIVLVDNHGQSFLKRGSRADLVIGTPLIPETVESALLKFLSPTNQPLQTA